MKTITCRQMGGPCDAQIHGETPEEMVNNGAAHVMDMGDDEHKKVLEMMEAMKDNPDQAEKWNADFATKFAALPEE